MDEFLERTRGSKVLPKLIVGLGNPGSKYENTRHNVGFLLLDRICASIGSTVREEHCDNSLVYYIDYRGRQLCLIKPLLYMNNSGEAVGQMVRSRGFEPEEILVLYDCLDLPFGSIRLRKQGGSGGHRGVESIIDVLGQTIFPRLRVGIGRPDSETISYVLSAWQPDELNRLGTVLDVAVEAVLLAVNHGVDDAMNKYNNWNLELFSDTAGKQPGSINT